MKKIFGLLSVLVLMFSACDDGHVDDPTTVIESTGYTAYVSGTFKKVDSWSGSYSVVIAGFSSESEYATIQMILPSTDESTSFTLDNIPSNTNTIEIAVVNSLRKRIATLYTYTIPEGQSTNSPIELDLGEMNVGMFDAINQAVFQSGTTTCAKCHQGDNPAGSLDLSSANAYASLVGIASTKAPDQKRVVPGNAENSYLYKVISTGDSNVHFSHTGFFAGDDMAAMLKLIKEWINNGAKE